MLIECEQCGKIIIIVKNVIMILGVKLYNFELPKINVALCSFRRSD